MTFWFSDIDIALIGLIVVAFDVKKSILVGALELLNVPFAFALIAAPSAKPSGPNAPRHATSPMLSSVVIAVGFSSVPSYRAIKKREVPLGPEVK
jgi:hypothetical protein